MKPGIFKLETRADVEIFLRYFREYTEDDFSFGLADTDPRTPEDNIEEAPRFLIDDVAQAEFDVLSYYVPHQNDYFGEVVPGYFPEVSGPTNLRPQLIGWVGEDLNNPDLERIDEALLSQLRRAIKEAFDDRPETGKRVERIQEGNRTIVYDSDSTPSTKAWTRHLRRFDDRQRHSFL